MEFGTPLNISYLRIFTLFLSRVCETFAVRCVQVDVSKVDIGKFDDAYFKPAEKKAGKKKTEEEFFNEVPLVLLPTV